MYTVGSLFTGVGMFDLGFAWAGFRVRWQVEFDAWCQELLRARGNIFDHPTTYGDVRDVGAGRQHEPGYADVLIGGFPCTPFSIAGDRKGADDHRNMWPDFRRNGRHHRAVKYRADFRYTRRDGVVFVEDVKGALTEVYKIKRKLLLAQLPEDVVFVEIPASDYSGGATRGRRNRKGRR